MIPYRDKKLIKKIYEALRKFSNQDLLHENQINIFEKICNKVGSKYSVAVNSATCVTYSMSCIRPKEKDYLWTVPNTFVASANWFILWGFNDFVDIDKDTLNISIENLKKLIEAKEKKKIPKIIVAVDFGGNPYDHKTF